MNMKSQKLATKTAFPLKFRVDDSGFDSDTLMKILSGAEVTAFFHKSTISETNPISIKSGCSRPNVSSSVVRDRNNNTHRKRVKSVEESVFCKRATLFRISPDDGKNKEQAYGNIEILRDPSTDKKQLLMWVKRKTKLIIFLNHALTSDIAFQRNGKKGWLWTAQDLSEGNGKTETFELLFKDVNISKAFKTAVLRKKISPTEANFKSKKYRSKTNDEEEVKSDEVDDDIFYSHRGKLYRFMSSVYEWKGKDLGDVKPLKRGKSRRNDRTRVDHRYGALRYEEADWFSD